MSNQTTGILKMDEVTIPIPSFFTKFTSDIGGLETLVRLSGDLLQFYEMDARAQEPRRKYWPSGFLCYTNEALCRLFFAIYKVRLADPSAQCLTYDRNELYDLNIDLQAGSPTADLFTVAMEHLKFRQDMQTVIIPLFGALIEISNSYEHQ
jgi:hypothetical protein